MTANRSYQKLTEVFGVLGGLFSLLSILGNTINKIENSVHLTVVLMNFLYSFQQPGLNVQNLKKKNNSLHAFFPPFQQKNKENNEKSFETPQKKKLEFSFSEYKSQEDPSLNEKLLTFKNKEKKRSNKLRFEKQRENILHEETMILSSRSFEIKSKKPRSGMPKLKIVDKPLEFWPSLQTVQIKEEITPNASPNRFQTQHSILSKFFKKLNFAKTPKVENLISLEEFMKVKEKKHQISFSLFGNLKLLIKKFCRISLNFKEKLFMRTQEVFEDEIDIVKILKRIQDIEKLKYLLLNDQQIMLFEVLEKPMIFVEETQKELNSSSSFILSPSRKKLNVDMKIRKAFDFYQELEKKSSRDPIDEKLFSLIDKSFKTYKKYTKTTKI